MKCITCFLSWQVVGNYILPSKGCSPWRVFPLERDITWKLWIDQYTSWDITDWGVAVRREHTLNIFIWLPSLLWHFELIHLDFSLIWASKFILVQQLLTFSSKLSHFLSFLHTITEVWIFDEDVDDDIDDKFSIFGI